MTKKQIIVKKEKALNRFINDVRETKEGKWIDNIIVHGSFAQGIADKDSDIDVLVFAKRPKEVEEVVDKIAYRVMLDEGEYIEPFVYPTKEHSMPSSYFIFNAIKRGKNINLYG